MHRASGEQCAADLGDPVTRNTRPGVGGEAARVVPVGPAETAALRLDARDPSPTRPRPDIGVDARSELTEVDPQAGSIGERLRDLHLLDDRCRPDWIGGGWFGVVAIEEVAALVDAIGDRK